MKISFRLTTVLFLLTGFAAFAADQVKLEANAKIVFEFPDLPETFYSKSTHEKHPAMLSAQLPENYTRDAKFPIFVFLDGGNGGEGNSSSARSIVGSRDFITVSLPLFRDASGAPPPSVPGLSFNTSSMVNINDAPALSGAYRTMLQKLFDAVPNITSERSALGGFSNGAHATGALLAAKDEFVLGHFTAFCLFEGGLELALHPEALQQPALKRCRFIMLFGDHDDDPKLQMGRTLIAGPLISKLQDQASARKLDFTYIVMHGYGHQMPPEYRQLLGNWVRGEKLPEIQLK
jgi:hypothetical protein